jgi:hypothetical protein
VQGKEEVLCRFVFGNGQWAYGNPGKKITDFNLLLYSPFFASKGV